MSLDFASKGRTADYACPENMCSVATRNITHFLTLVAVKTVAA